MFNKTLNKDSINTIEIVHIFMMNRLPFKKINFRFCLSDPRHPVTSTFRDLWGIWNNFIDNFMKLGKTMYVKHTS